MTPHCVSQEFTKLLEELPERRAEVGNLEPAEVAR